MLKYWTKSKLLRKADGVPINVYEVVSEGERINHELAKGRPTTKCKKSLK